MTSTYRWKKLRDRLIAERSWICGLCGKPITDRADIALDHIFSVSEDWVGEHDPFDETKLQLTHSRCNSLKGPGRSLPDPRDQVPWLRDRLP